MSSCSAKYGTWSNRARTRPPSSTSWASGSSMPSRGAAVQGNLTGRCSARGEGGSEAAVCVCVCVRVTHAACVIDSIMPRSSVGPCESNKPHMAHGTTRHHKTGDHPTHLGPHLLPYTPADEKL